MKTPLSQLNYQNIYRKIHRQEINNRSRNRNRKLLQFLKYKCKICGNEILFDIKSKRGKYCNKCKIEQYREMHRKAAYNYYLRNKNV